MTIHELLALTGLTVNDEIPVWDAEASGEPTKKITAQNLAAAIKTLASLLGTGDVVNDLTSTETQKPGSANMLRVLNEAIAQSTACKIVTGTVSVAVPNSGTVNADFTGLVPSDYKVRGGLFMIGGYQLPYLSGGTYTFASTITSEGVVTIDNTASGWGTQTVAAVLFLVER